MQTYFLLCKPDVMAIIGYYMRLQATIAYCRTKGSSARRTTTTITLLGPRCSATRGQKSTLAADVWHRSRSSDLILLFSLHIGLAVLIIVSISSTKLLLPSHSTQFFLANFTSPCRPAPMKQRPHCACSVNRHIVRRESPNTPEYNDRQ